MAPKETDIPPAQCKKRKGKDPRIRELSVILYPYSNRRERIGAHILVYEERERVIIKYAVLNKEKGKKSPATTLGLFLPENLKTEQEGLSPADALSY